MCVCHHDYYLGGQREKKILQKPITSELGTVAPWIIGPGAWTDEEVRHHALYFTACLMHNNSCNCMSPQVLILPQHGFPTEKFMSQVYGRIYISSNQLVKYI